MARSPKMMIVWFLSVLFLVIESLSIYSLILGKLEIVAPMSFVAVTLVAIATRYAAKARR